jgi:hypothetical protein
MRIFTIKSQNRRDFTAILECEGCGEKQELRSGYDDRNYHDNVIPAIKCKTCGKTRNDLGIIAPFTPTKYADWEVV